MLTHSLVAVTELSLDELARPGIEQVRRYARGQGVDDERHALEIVRRAAGREPAAFATLIGLCDPLIEQGCPADLWTWQDELERETVRRMERRFFHHPVPFAVTTLPAFVRYVRIAVHTGVVTLRRRGLPSVALDASGGWDPTVPSSADRRLEVEASRAVARALLASLDNPFQREALLRRLGYGQSVAAIQAALRTRAPDLTAREVYRLLDHGKRGLRRAAARDVFLGRRAA